MAIAAQCPTCRAAFQLDAGLAGKNVRCQKCHTVFPVPAPAPVPAAPVPAHITAASPGSPVREPVIDVPLEMTEPAGPMATVPTGSRPPAPKRSATPWIIGAILLVGGGVLVMVMVACAGVGFWMYA